MVFGREVRGQNCSTSQRIYADSQTPTTIGLGPSITNAGNAVNGNIDEYSTLSVGLVGSASQNLKFTGSVKPSSIDPVTVKLGFGAAVLSVLGGISVQATLNGTAVGTEYKSTTLLGLLGGSNENELTFIPNVPYDGVKITVSGLGVGISAKLFHAYFNTLVTNRTACDNPIDIVSGVGTTATNLANLASFTASFVDVKKAIDNSDATFSTINIGVQALAYAQETALFETQSHPGDSIRIVLSRPSGLLTLGLLANFKIQLYNGSTPVGSVIDGNSSLLNLTLLSGGTSAIVTYAPSSDVFDRIQIRLESVVGLLSALNIHEIQRISPTRIEGSNIYNEISICKGTNITLPQPSTSCTTYKWYDSAIGGQEIPSTNNGLTLNTSSLLSGTYYIQPIRFGCPSMKRGVAKITVNPLPLATISGTTSVCLNSTSPSITFTGNGGTAPYTFTYKIDGGPSQTTPVSIGNSVTITTPTSTIGSFSYDLISVKDASSTQCSNNITGQTAIVTVTPLPAITILHDYTICISRSSLIMNYSNPVNSPISYNLDWDVTANSAGWVDLNNKPFDANNTIILTLPIGIIPNTYHAQLTVNNGSCQSLATQINVTIYPNPIAPTIAIAN